MVEKISSGAVAHIPGANMEEFLVTILDGFVKSPTAALRFIFRHCGVLASTPHSSRFTSLAFGLFTLPSHFVTFYEFIILSAAKRSQTSPLSYDSGFSEPMTVDQKFFSVSGMGIGQQTLERRGATFPEIFSLDTKATSPYVLD